MFPLGKDNLYKCEYPRGSNSLWGKARGDGILVSSKSQQDTPYTEKRKSGL